MNRATTQSHEPPSCWQVTGPRITFAADLQSSADVVVIGGGIVGASTCYWLARAKRKVVLLERTAVAAGAMADPSPSAQQCPIHGLSSNLGRKRPMLFYS